VQGTLVPSWDVAISGDRIVCGLPEDDTLGAQAGTALVFEREGTTWSQVATLYSTEPVTGEWFGTSVSISGDRIAIGAPGPWNKSALPGAAYVFRLLDTPPFCDASDGALASCPCGNAGAPDSGCDIATGTGGVRLDVLAQETTPANRLTFRGTGFQAMAAPAALALRATALEPLPVPFGDGLRCIGLPVVRLNAVLASGGSAVIPVMHGPAAGPGSFYYQLWFRDQPAMFCTPDAFNLSNGRQVAW
jgi:hypothetical protein